MPLTHAIKPAPETKFVKISFKKNFRKNWRLLLFVLPALIYVLIFAYLPMYGIVIAFQDFTPVDDILGPNANWIGFGNFLRFFNEFRFWRLLTNTFLLSLFGFLVGFPIPIIVALMLNSLKNQKIAKKLQTIFYAPHFISVVVLVGMLYLFFGEYGLINNIARSINLEAYSYFLQAEAFRPLFIFSGNWQDFGWSAIIYLAALSGVDPHLHEAAIVEGASRVRRIFAIDIPAIIPTISIILILSIGNLMSVGYEKAFLMQTGANIVTSEIIATYVYKIGFLGTGEYGYATAIGLFNSIINVILLVIANISARKFSGNSIW
jgi:putative aldouronate transport system permease protein